MHPLRKIAGCFHPASARAGEKSPASWLVTSIFLSSGLLAARKLAILDAARYLAPGYAFLESILSTQLGMQSKLAKSEGTQAPFWAILALRGEFLARVTLMLECLGELAMSLLSLSLSHTHTHTHTHT